MKHSNFKFLIILIFSLLPVNNVMAHHCLGGHASDPGCPTGGGGGSGTVVIDSTTVNLMDQAIYFNGSGLDTAPTVELAGATISTAVSNAEGTQLRVEFDLTLAGIITGPGIYFFTVGSLNIPVYFITAVGDPAIPASCPCEPEWSSYGAESSPDGFSDLPSTCKVNTIDQVYVRINDPEFPYNIWIMNTAFKSIGQECSLVIDEPARALSSYQEHEACVSYLETYHGPIALIPDC